MDCFLLPLHRGGRCISVITTHELRFRKETRIIACLSRRRGLRQHKSNMNIVVRRGAGLPLAVVPSTYLTFILPVCR